MTPHEYALLDVFTDKKFGGNQLAVFRSGHVIPEHALQPIAKELNLPETVFVMPPLIGGDHRLRIFTPARELPFAGHPTVGAAFFLSGGVDATLRIEEKVGTLQVTVRDGFTEMEQPLPEFRPGPAREQIAPLLSLRAVDIDASLPTEIGSSGNAFIFVPVNGLDDVKRAAPRGLTDAAFLFTRQTLAPESTVHGRMFAGWQGVTEDPRDGLGLRTARRVSRAPRTGRRRAHRHRAGLRDGPAEPSLRSRRRHAREGHERARRRPRGHHRRRVDRRMRRARYRPRRTPADLARRLRCSSSDAALWCALTPAARRVARHRIGQAQGARVREWRVADAWGRAARYERGAGPFYLTAADQRRLARPRRTAR